jgi:hypothetical protein
MPLSILVRHAAFLCTAAVGLAVASGACGGGAATPPALKDDPLPDRVPADDDAGEPDPPPPPPPRSDAGPDAGKSALCTGNDLALCFPFEGQVKDESLNAFVPAVVNGVTFGPGKAGQAATFTDSSAIRFDGPMAKLNATATTVEAWIRVAQISAEGVVFDADNRYAMSVQPGTGANGQIQCNNGGGTIVRGGDVIIGQWMHAACVFDTSTIRLYLDGTERKSAGGGPSSSSAGAAIGGNSPSGAPFIGSIDSFRVFFKARTPAEILAAAAP